MQQVELLQDKYDLMIDWISEEILLFPEKNIMEILAKAQEEFNYKIDNNFIYYLLKKILKFWVDMEEDYYDVVACWILGTYFFDVWITYPYMFINAVKRSGKTRLLKLMSYLSKDGVYTMSLTESVLFRLPSIKKCGLFIDEIENIASKEKFALRELLNVAYKKGGKVFRMRKNPYSEKYIPEEFELFIPVAMANISGLEDVLNDRCITIVLERSLNKNITNKLEFFDYDPKIRLFKYLMSDNCLVSLVSVVTLRVYSIYRDITLFNTIEIYHRSDTNDTNDIINKNIKEFEKNDIIGRDLELWLPLFVMKEVFTEDISDMIQIASKYVKERKISDIMEDKDNSFLIFLFNFIKDRNPNEFISYKELKEAYKEYEGYEINSNILSKILKRLKVVVEKRRLANTREVIFDFEKIKKKVKDIGIEINEEKPEIQSSLDFSNELDEHYDES